MIRRSKSDDEPAKARRRKNATLKRHNAPKALRRRRTSAADQETEVARLTRERDEALAHQATTAEVLQVIGSSMADAQPVFERIVDSIERLLSHKHIGIFLTPGDGLMHAATVRGVNSDRVFAVYPLPVEQSAAPYVLETRQQVYFPDLLKDGAPPSLRRVAETAGNFSDVLTPMLWEGRGVGMIAVMREPNVPFSERELSLLRTFADQAVIAIENARLFNETQEALERQTATADILKVIASSPSDVQLVFEAIATSALLNLISNGFYAATRRIESDNESFEPVLCASTRNLGQTVEIRIRDNGTGIPSDVKEKMFVPFFTTKPTGEGTGLGLSMTHDIIVKEHGGRIDVETQPGAFTEFIFTLPRGNGSAARSKPE